jgi:hypothetical protein
MTDPGAPSWQPEQALAAPPPSLAVPAPPRRRYTVLVVAAAVAVLLVGAGAVVLKPKIVASDSGVSACKSFTTAQANPTPKASGDSKPMTEAEYKTARKRFSDSRYADLRDSGTTFVDLLYQVSGPGADSLGLGLIGLANQMIASYADLAHACANHGVVLKPITAN